MRYLFFFFFPLFVLASSLDDRFPETFITGQPALWVQSFDYDLSPSTQKPSQINTQYLLIDIQRNWEEKATFERIAIKPLTQAGVEELASWSLYCNPAFEQAIIHSIRVYRNGTWQDRLLAARHHILQREDNLDAQSYNGYLILVYFLPDIRVGDIVEYQYSFKGENPFLSTHFDDVVYLQHSASIEKISYRLLAHPSRPFAIKPFHTHLSLNIQDLSSHQREWSITVSETEAVPHEPRRPAWSNPYARIQINEYQSWNGVRGGLSPLFVLPEIFLSHTPKEIVSLVQEWISISEDAYERARLAIRFVQDEIHYLSLSEGISALKPEDPALIFMRRFGDCKDKTLLLHGLLKLMNIDSTPILVHDSSGLSLPEALPSPYLFNHYGFENRV